MTSKKILKTYNLSEQDLINYNPTDFSLENNNINILNNRNELNISDISNEKSQENLIEIEIKNIHMLILQRSLYIMKKRFEQNKKELDSVYEKYKDKNYRQLKCINTNNLFDLYKEIMDTIQINLLPYENFNELITADLMTKFNKEKYITMINALVKFTRNNIEKYNTLFYENKIKKKKLKEEQENKKNPKPQEVEVTGEVRIVHKDKRGNIIDNFEKMIENNKKIDIKDLIITINEDDMSILTNKKLLYNDVIPLIIADFLQEYLKNNINIGIILSNQVLSNNNDDINENIKILFDKEIIKKYNNLNKIDPKEEKREKLKNLLFESNNIDNQIRIYKELIVENSNKGLESSYLISIIAKLKEKKKFLEKRINEINKKKYFISNNMNNEQYFNTLNTNNNISSIEYKLNNSKLNKSKNNSKLHMKLNNKKLNRKEIRETNLFEIFSFYSKQHSFLGKTPSIESVIRKEKLMNLSEFAKFCIDFKIMVKNNKINEIFKKNIKGGTYMSFEEFTDTLGKMAVLVNEEKKQYIKERINLNQLKLQEIIEKEKKKKRKLKKKKNKNPQIEKDNNNEEIKNEEQNNKNEINEEEKKDNNQNQENKDDNKEENNEGNNKENKEDQLSEQGQNNINNSENIEKQDKKSENPILLNNKEDLEGKIAKLKNDYNNLESKSLQQLEEELYIFLEIDDSSAYRKKMVGYVLPFAIREKDTRNPDKNVKHPIKFNPKNIKEMYNLLMQRSEDLKKEKELKKMKEKDIQFEKRKQKFNKEIKKLEKDYDSKINKNYQQIKKNEEDYLKEKTNKLTWQLIQNCDYQSFLSNENLNVGKNRKKNKLESHLDDIFVDQSNQLFDEDFINNVYSNKKQRQSHDNYIFNSRLSSDNYIRNPHIQIDSNKRYQMGKKY